MDDMMHVPELDDARFYAEVMQLDVDRTEGQHDSELLAKAHELGIMATLPTVSKAHRLASSTMSDSTNSISREQAVSTASDGSTGAYSTPHSSIYGVPSPDLSSSCDNGNNDGFQRQSLDFSPYEEYLAKAGLALPAPSAPRSSMASLERSDRSIFNVRTKNSLSDVKARFRDRFRRRKKPAGGPEPPLSCSKCDSPLSSTNALQNLPCGHANCTPCLTDLTVQATKKEASMPPSCCAKPVPSESLRQALDVDMQRTLLNAVLHYSTPSESRVFCCNLDCREFIPPSKRVDTKMPSALTCLQCQSKVCQLCRKDAHDIGTHCPEDAELLDALETSGRDSWRRCYRCCQLVAPSDPTGPVTCACKAKFCLSCGGVWDIPTGCPNLCPRERDPILRREDKAQTPPQQGPAQRSMQHPEVQSLLQAQRNEMRRMLDFKNAALTSLEARQAAQETALTDQHIQDRDELVAKQARDASQLEDRQISDELELRNKLEQAEWSNTIRIKYMEAYCEAPSQSPSVSSSKSSTSSSSSLPPRVVTEKNLRDLGRQYSLREKVQREHESKIYMLRVRQSKKMEDLVQSHGAQLRELIERNREAREAFGERVRRERKTFDGVFGARQARLTARWALSIQVQCRELQGRDGLRYALVAPPSWMGGEALSEEAGL